MSMNNWYERQRAVVNVGQALKSLGWTLLGYKKDMSDGRCDHFDPARWEGVASKDGSLICVDVVTNHMSGKPGFPTYQVNPPNKKWHIEREGRIIGSGIGLGRCTLESAADALARQLDQAAFPKPVAPGAKVGEGVGYRIEEHRHTKLGVQMWLVILDGRVDRDEFVRLRAQAQLAGGWYSRQWGATPGGFAFKSPGAAQGFAEANVAAELAAV